MTPKQVLRDVRLEEKRTRVLEIAAQPSVPVLDAYPVLCADPPWRYERAPTPTRAVENQYPTMSTDDICSLEVPAAEDSVLFLWATAPKLPEALDVMEAWGFTYRTNMVWVKDRPGMGWYARSRHELLLIGRRGSMPVPDEEDRPESVLNAPRGEHSEKPVEAYRLIESMYPLHPRVELFARGQRPGWAVWGNQADAA
jgi:N6-adenosine-specific RNA methylase IME4